MTEKNWCPAVMLMFVLVACGNDSPDASDEGAVFPEEQSTEGPSTEGLCDTGDSSFEGIQKVVFDQNGCT